MDQSGNHVIAGRSGVATFGPRFLAFCVDAVLANLMSIIVNAGYRRDTWGSMTVAIAFLLIELVFVTSAGQTPGMRVAGIGVVRAVDSGRPQFRWVAVRTALLATVVPALFTDRSGRALHDRAAGTVMIRTR